MSSTRDPDAVATRSALLAPFRIIWAHRRLFTCVGFGALVWVALPFVRIESDLIANWLPLELHGVTRALVGWNAGVFAYLARASHKMRMSTQDDLRIHAKDADEGRGVVLFLSAAAACAAIGAIVLELGQIKSLYEAEKAPRVLLAIVTVVASWAFMHLIFALHYAHEYYFEKETSQRRKELRGGLIFPGEHAPQYRDFLYYAYVIGVAGQTADVSTTSAAMRKITLIHGVLAFFYNTTIFALAVNIASDFV